MCVCIYIYRNCSRRHVWHCYFWCSLAARGFLPPTYWYHMVGNSTSSSPSSLCSRLKSNGLSQLDRKKMKKKGEAKLSVQLQSSPCFSWNVGHLFQQGYVCVRACYVVFPWLSFHSALFILLGCRSGQPQYSEAWWFGLGDTSCGLHYWRSPLKSQPCQDRPELLIIRQLCPKSDELGAFWPV